MSGPEVVVAGFSVAPEAVWAACGATLVVVAGSPLLCRLAATMGSLVPPRGPWASKPRPAWRCAELDWCLSLVPSLVVVVLLEGVASRLAAETGAEPSAARVALWVVLPAQFVVTVLALRLAHGASLEGPAGLVARLPALGVCAALAVALGVYACGLEEHIQASAAIGFDPAAGPGGADFRAGADAGGRADGP